MHDYFTEAFGRLLSYCAQITRGLFCPEGFCREPSSGIMSGGLISVRRFPGLSVFVMRRQKMRMTAQTHVTTDPAYTQLHVGRDEMILLCSCRSSTINIAR